MEEHRGQDFSARLLFALTALFWCAQYSYTHFLNPELEAMGKNAAFMGLVSGAYGLTQTLLRIPAGLLADRIGRKKPFVVAGCVLTALAGLVFLLFYNPGGFLAARGLAGVASASWVSFTVLYGAYFSYAEGPRRISHLNSANMGGRLVGYLVILAASPLLGRRFAFVFSLASGVMSLVMSLGLREAPQARQGITLKDLLRVSRDRYLRVCSIVAVLAQWVAFSTYYGFIVNAAKALGAQEAELSLLNIFLLVPTLVFNYLLTGALMQRYKPRALVFLGFLSGALYCLLVPLATSIGALYALQTLAGLSSTLTFALLLGQSMRDIPASLRAVAMGFFQAVYGIGMTLGPLATGLVMDLGGLGSAFSLLAAFSLLSGLLAYRMMDIPRPPVEEPGRV